MKKIGVFDIEVLRNCFICCVKIDGKIHTFEISKRRNDLEIMYKLFTSNEIVFVGYNNIHYDNPVMNYIIMNIDTFRKSTVDVITMSIKNLSDNIINDDSQMSWKMYKYKTFFHSIDLMTLMFSKDLRVALKSLQVTMCYHNVKEMSIDWDKEIAIEDIDNLIYYCENDVGSTSYLAKLLKNDLSLRVNITKDFDIQCLSKDGVGIGVDIFTKFICEHLEVPNKTALMRYRTNFPFIKVKDYIAPCISFKTKPLQEIHDWYKNMTLDSLGKINGKSPTREVLVNKLKHACGIGGLHSVNKPIVYNPEPGYIYRDKDVTSFYPSLSEMWGFAPAGFKREFISIITQLKALRVEAKKKGLKTKDLTYKLALNSILGHLRNEYSPYYAPEANVGICVSGQLMLLMLIEECEMNGIECISSNTDGATFKIPCEKETLFENICTEWSEKTRMGLEAVDYEKMVILAVNDYIAFKEGYSKVKDQIDFDPPELSIEYNYAHPLIDQCKYLALKNQYVKEKGFFITYPRLGKGLDCLIIPKALQNYFGKGIPVNQTVKEFRSIYDYMKFEKVGRSFEVFWNNQKQQQINRFYMSKSAPYLKKGKVVETNHPTKGYSRKYSYQDVVSGYGVMLTNEVTNPTDESLYKINYNYYIERCNNVIQTLESNQLSLF